MECILHGKVKFNKCIDKGKERWRCSKCLIDSVNKRRRILKTKSIEYKGNECNDCGYNKSKSALEFHHIDSTQKEFSISDGNIKSFNRIITELNKCLLLCANCHREEHDRIDKGDYVISPINSARIQMLYFEDVNN